MAKPETIVSESMEAEAKDRAASVVLAWRELDWDAVEQGDRGAVTELMAACENHEQTQAFLLTEAGGLGEKLNEGLERFYATSVGPHMRRPAVLRQISAGERPEPINEGEPDGLAPRARPQVTVGHTIRMNTGCGHLYVTVNESENGLPFELFNHMGKAGGCAASQNEAIGRLISYALRCGARIEPLIKQLKGISCHRPAWGEDGKISSCSDAIGKALEKYYAARELRHASLEHGGQAAAAPERGGETGVEFEAERKATTDAWSRRSSSHGGNEASKVQGACVDCGGQLSYEEGCVKCHSCGFTECG
ncbi:MAG: TSCPD domain-containing protein [Planctomycetes bacterium]|nr:TSCPD domain-containing protein [Planctomycetota bacterium]